MTSCLIESSSNLQIIRTGIQSCTSSILGDFQLLALKLPALEGLTDLGKCNRTIAISFLIKSSSDLLVMWTAIKSWEEFDFGADQTSHLSYLPFSLPWIYNEENVVWMIATAFFIRSSCR